MSDNQFHNQISRELGRIGESLNNIHFELTEVKQQITIANGRTRKLEDWRLKIDTRVGIISATVSTIVAAVVWFVGFVNK